jgi:hypothetical protein
MDPEPQPDGTPLARRQRLIQEVDELLRTDYGGQRIDNAESRKAALPTEVREVWQIRSGLSEEADRLFVALDNDFPATLPRIHLPYPERWHLRIPHVAKCGAVCIAPEHATANQQNVMGALRDAIARAVKIIEDGMAESNYTDFVDEIETYWAGKVDTRAKIVLSLIEARPPTRQIFCVPCNGFILLGHSVDQCKKWLSRRAGRESDHKCFATMFVWTDKGLLPKDYFETNGDVFAFLASTSPESLAVLARTAGFPDRRPTIIVAMPTKNRPGMLGVSLGAPRDRKDKCHNGFRPGTL